MRTEVEVGGCGRRSRSDVEVGGQGQGRGYRSKSKVEVEVKVIGQVWMLRLKSRSDDPGRYNYYKLYYTPYLKLWTTLGFLTARPHLV